MMKFLFQFFFLLSTVQVFAKPFPMITQKQFKNLSKKDQIRYLKGLQNVMVEMSRSTPYMAEAFNQEGRIPAATADAPSTTANGDWTEGVIGDESSIVSTAIAKPVTSGQANGVPLPTPTAAAASQPPASASAPTSVTPKSPLKTPSTSASAPAVAASSSGSSARNPTLEESLAPDEVIEKSSEEKLAESKMRAASKQQTRVKPVISSGGAITELVDEADSGGPQQPVLPPPSTNKKPLKASAPSASTPAERPQPPTEVSPSKTESPAETEKKPIAKSKEKETSDDFSSSGSQFRCMYAGWIVETGKCVGPNSIPDWMNLGLSEENKSCPKNYVACNPVLFGLELPKDCKRFADCKDKAKPLCAQKGLRPTWECQQKASAGFGLPTQVAAEINSNSAPQLYTDFQMKFKGLCGNGDVSESYIAENPFVKNHKRSKVVLKDIFETCKKAYRQMEDLNIAMNVEPFYQTEAKMKSQQNTKPAQAPTQQGQSKK